MIGDMESGTGRSRANRGIGSPLVGRSAEFSALKRRVEGTIEGHGGVVTVRGEAGVGKSRLVSEIRDHMCDPSRNPGMTWLEGRAVSAGRTMSYWPFHEILRQFAGITEQDREPDAWSKMRRGIRELVGHETADMLPYLATLISLEVRGEYVERVKYLDGEAMRRQVFLTCRRFLERLALDRSLVLVFEDLQWIDESSSHLLEHLVPLVHRVPLLLVAVSRPTAHAPAVRLVDFIEKAYFHRYAEIRLEPLSPFQVNRLAANLIGSKGPLPPELEKLVHKSEGNPFYVEEIIRSLIDTDVLERVPDAAGCRVTTLDAIRVPDRIKDVIMERVKRLDTDVNRSVKVAAVIGRSFLYRILRSVARAGDDLDRHLRKLLTLELIREKRREPEREYFFKHALAHEAIYESIPEEERRVLHAEVARALEESFTERAEEYHSVVAYHYARAENWRKAQEYLFKAGDQAERVAADTEALEYYQKARDAYARAFGDHWDPVLEASLERKIGEALFRRGRHGNALEYLQRSLAHLGAPLPTSHWRTRLEIVSQVFRQLSHRTLPWLLPHNRPPERRIVEIVRNYEIIAWVDAFSNTERFLLDTITMLNVAEGEGYGYGTVQGLLGLGLTCDLTANFRLAGLYHQLSVTVAERIAHTAGIAWAYLGQVVHNSSIADWSRVLAYATKAAEAFSEVGDLHSWAYVIYSEVHALAFRAEYATALTKCRDVVIVGEDGSDLQVVGWGKMGEGHIMIRQARFQEAQKVLRQAKESLASADDRVNYVATCHDLALSYLRAGRLDEALAEIDQLEKYFTRNPAPATVWVGARNVIAEGYLLMAEQSEGTDKHQWLEKAGSACMCALNQAKLGPALLPEALRLKGTHEWLTGKRRSARSSWRRSLKLAEKLGQPYDSGMSLLEMGRRCSDSSQVERAESIFSRIGAQQELSQAREAMGRRSR